MRVLTAATLLSFLAACSPNDPAAPEPSTGIPARAEPEPARTSDPRGASLHIDKVRAIALDASLAEDGRGGRAVAPHPVAVQIAGRGIAGRAFDPVLRAGELTFRFYEMPRPSVLRFVLADAALLRGPLELELGEQRVALPAPSIEDDPNEELGR